MKAFKTAKRTKLILLRTAKGWSQTETAKRLGISITTYCFLETGRSNGTPDLWKRIQEVFHVEDKDMWALQNPKDGKED